MNDQLRDIALKIDQSLTEEESSIDEKRWVRANLYLEARKILNSAKAFSTWLQELEPNQRIDHKTVIPKLIVIAEILDKETFLYLGYGRSLALTPKWLHQKHKKEAAEFIDSAIAENWTVKQCKDAIRDLALPGWENSIEEQGEDEDYLCEVNKAPTVKELLERIKELDDELSNAAKQLLKQQEKINQLESALAKYGKVTGVYHHRPVIEGTCIHH
ncbi:hypothetical protein [Buttiauxella noackiae]|uniref:hypothetical protein n=1 Tax=Buttiauxella noackiae TaxID=82992 RepID=UPI0028D6B0F3|nr:hypothetical protein [Buttiauxella noackiae]